MKIYSSKNRKPRYWIEDDEGTILHETDNREEAVQWVLDNMDQIEVD